MNKSVLSVFSLMFVSLSLIAFAGDDPSIQGKPPFRVNQEQSHKRL
jgi:hypothetical protein